MDNIQSQPDAYRKAFFHIRPDDLSSPFFSHLPRWELTSGLKRFYSKQTKAGLKNFNVYAEQAERLPSGYENWNHFEQAQYLESTMLLPGYILSSQGDRMAMGHSVEGRFPFLDHRVVEFACRIPSNLKMKVLNEKFALKRAMADMIPPSIAQRTKQPYRAPDAVSLLGGKDSSSRPEYANELLSKKSIEESGIFESSAVDKLIRKFESGRAIGVRDNMALVGILSTQLIMQQFIHNFRS
jgi:asparagine synthase (glutamine-hydrolysing)